MKRFLYILVGCLTVVTCCGCGAGGRREKAALAQSVDTAMGTIVSQSLYGTEGDTACEEILQLLINLEQQELSWRIADSEVSRINALAGTEEGLVISSEMAEWLKICLEVSRSSEGAFDITLGELSRLWDIDSWAGAEGTTEYSLPTWEEISKCLEHIGYEQLVVKQNTLVLTEGMQLDLGAVGKGIALDEIREYLEAEESLTGAVISVGGSVLTYGQKPDNSPWRVGIVNPLNANNNLGYLELEGIWCVSTSGDYERYVEVDGVRYHHILNPHTGYPADSGIRGVTILSKSGLLSDALSTACFILGAEKGSQLVGDFGAEALFVDREGNIIMTDGMKQYFHLSR